MQHLHYRTMHGPVGKLTLAGTAGRLRHLRMVDQTYEPNRDDWQHDDAALLRVIDLAHARDVPVEDGLGVK